MSYSRERLQRAQEAMGIAAKKSLGQNFLVSDTVINRIIDQVKVFAPEELVEVGPGPGALTDLLLELNLPMQVIELDSAIAAYWREKGLTVIEQDALRLDWKQFYTGKRVVFVSNLPYQISSSIVIERSLENEGVAAMVLMFQKEVAQKIRGTVDSDLYGLLSVFAQAFWKIETVTDAGPRDFQPPPKVASRVLSFERIESDVKNRKAFLTFVKCAFAQRRKLLKKNLSGLLSQKKLTEEQLVGWLAELGFKETARAEELSPKQFVALYKHFGFE
ncbi:16S rRNA (adenine(1518)-N(6)/adenine(1519)-N(6))-dimethyltransferase RsmA [Bdellovibrio bacteriovorus]|uniref:16S rRNA (adenine(1518)-N(6)/adenine(1519)-N(6))- dimethyltransferase RsmA n=1 Tax=Bdellovibrio bacteriovorus TaxID=959 RepID=UPI003AA997BC